MNGISWKSKKDKWKGHQFHHHMQVSGNGVIPRFTASVSVPTKKQLTKLVQNLVETKVGTITLGLGLSIVNPKDTYNKKLGRELSFERLEKYEFEIRSALTMNYPNEMSPPFKTTENKSFTNVELRAIKKGKAITVWFRIDKRDKVVLMNVIPEAWPNYSFKGYKAIKEEDCSAKDEHVEEEQTVYRL
jgi:hypothetical protein